MAETLLRYQQPVSAPNGTEYEARACARPTAGGLWQAWIEFVPIAAGQRVRTARETTQPNRVDTVYWATGVSPVYLEGALRRALSRQLTTPALRAQLSIFGQPRLDPFVAYEKGEPHLRRRLAVLSASQLTDIAVGEGITVLGRTVLECLPHATLLELIVLGVTRRRRRPRGHRRRRSINPPSRAAVARANTTQSGR
ncbi:MAG: hypothetical protein JWL71_394 [Acidobacteria bacterium]|nr:hypothetical protein [Acidobacteriota bacterium]